MAADSALATEHGQPVDKKKLILIVDDEIDISSILELYLQMEGFDTAVASNGREALEFMAKCLPDLIISDCMMPFMTGPEMLRQLHAIPDTRQIPRILMSAATDRHDLSDIEFNIFLPKPFRLETLMREVNSLLKDDGNSQSDAGYPDKLKTPPN
jgi:CheY-like chemotaxis protein